MHGGAIVHGRTEGHAPARTAVRRRLLSLLAGGGAALAGATLAAGPRSAPVEAGPTGKGLVGAWLVTVPMTPRGRFMSVQTFSLDGTTVTQAESAGVEQGASLGCGVWEQTGDRRFALTFATARYHPETGATTGYAIGQGTLVLDAAGDTWSGEGRFTFFDADGRRVYQTPMFAVSATRIRLEPLA
jgi:hypothetical protein